ncbi:MAG TPA: hypothetical protein DEP87_01730, partial [Candidatus Pacebacteria bacterium]|nr:hypothetical protein [Candidatus Paceibacterota bacterium]
GEGVAGVAMAAKSVMAKVAALAGGVMRFIELAVTIAINIVAVTKLAIVIDLTPGRQKNLCLCTQLLYFSEARESG